MVHNSHFFVIVIELTGKPWSDFYMGVEYYDLMNLCTRVTKRQGAASHVCAFLNEFHKFVLHFVCNGCFDIGRPQTEVTHKPCPTQGNLIDSGLFSLGVVLHIMDGVPINNDIFDQECTDKLRSDLATHLGTVKNVSKYPLPCTSIIRGCFPAFLAVNNTDDDGTITVLGVLQNTESASAESTPSVVKVIMDGVSIAEESPNAAELSTCAVKVVLDGAATNEESATNATETSPSMLKLLMDMLSTRSKRRSKREGMAVKFEAEEKRTHIDMLALVTA